MGPKWRAGVQNSHTDTLIPIRQERPPWHACGDSVAVFTHSHSLRPAHHTHKGPRTNLVIVPRCDGDVIVLTRNPSITCMLTYRHSLTSTQAHTHNKGPHTDLVIVPRCDGYGIILMAHVGPGGVVHNDDIAQVLVHKREVFGKVRTARLAEKPPADEP